MRLNRRHAYGFICAILLAVTTATGLLLSGCGDAKDATPTIRFWAAGNEPYRSAFEPLIEKFNTLHEGRYHVEFEAFPRLHQKLMYAFAARKAPDIGMMDTWQVSAFVGHNLVAPLDFKNIGLDPDDFYACGLDGWRKDGKIYGMPINLNSGGATLLYNAKHLKEAGIPTPPRFDSWEALFEAAQKLTQRDEHGNITRAGFSSRAWDILGVTNIIKSLGGEFLDPVNKRIFFDTPEGKQAIRIWMASLKEYDTDNTNLPRPPQGFFQGRVSMTVLDADMIAVGRAEYPDFQAGADTIPKVIKRGDKLKGQFVSYGPWALCISRFTDNIPLCETLLAFLCQPENRLYYLEHCNAMPEKRSLAQAPFYTDPASPGYAYRTLIEDAGSWEFVGHLGQTNKIMWDIFSPSIQELRAGNSTIDETTKRLTRQCTQAIKAFYEE